MYPFTYAYVKQVIKFTRFINLLFIFLTLNVQLQAKSYYISSSGGGNDTYTSTQAQNPITPWKSIAMVNSFFKNILPGDSILFKRGDVFYGSLNIISSGALNKSIFIGAYGTGNKPVISGFKLLSSWTQNSTTGIFQANTTGISNNLNLVCINNQPQRIGRFPNADDLNGGYLNFEVGTNTFITDNQLPASSDWSGAELVIRKARHVIERWPISNQVGTTINYLADSNKAYQLPDYVTSNSGFGYFIQKDIRCLDRFGEWFYDTKSGNLNMYFGTANPSAYTVKVSTIDILLNISSFDFITVKDLAFEGANVQSINIGSLNNSSSTVNINNCDFYNSGANAVYATNSNRIVVQNCNINNSYNNGIEIENEGGPSSFINIARNNINNTGTDPGMGIVYGVTCQAITTYASDATIEFNNIDSTGYMGIAFYFNNAKVKNNYITNFGFVKDDGGGIYTWTGPVGGPVYFGREVKNNILINGIGAGFGTPNGLKTVYGIYMDDGAVGVDISGNSSAHIAGSGLYIHNTHEVNITDNTVFNCDGTQMSYVHDNITPTDPIRNAIFKKNIMVAKTADQLCFIFRTIKNDINLSGPTDSNYFARPINDDITISGISPIIKTTYSLDRWRANFTGKDVSSKKSPKIILPYIVNKLNTINLFTNSYFLTNMTSISFWSQNNNQVASWDNTNKITGTGALKLAFPVIAPNIFTLCTKSGLGAVSNLKNYIVRFSTLGSTTDGMLKVYLNNSSTNTKIVPIQVSSYNAARKNHEFLFAAPTSSSATSFVIEIQQNSGTTYLDNIEFFEADITPVDINNEIRFEFNPTEVNKTVILGAKYLGVDSTNYDGTITLLPYSSKVLFKNGSVSPLNATATAPVISCFGGSTTATLTGSGGIFPYTGTGSFTATSGAGTLRIAVPVPITGNYTSLFSSIGAINSNKNYLLRFSTLSTTNGGTLRASVRQTNVPFALLTPAQAKTFGTTRLDHEVLFTALTPDANASFLIEILQATGIVYIDNIAVFEANAIGLPISNNLYNNGQFDTSINAISTSSPTNNHIAALDLSNKITNNYYYPVTDAAGTIAIATLVTKQPSTALVANAAQGVTTSGVTTVTITAIGGTAPYSGTGTITNVQPGTYNYTVFDSLGCTAPVTVTVTVINRTPLSASASAPTINCFGGNTIATISATGGFAPYTGTGSSTINAGRGSLKIAVPNPVTGNNTSAYAPVGAVSNSKNYVLRLSTVGSTANGVVRARLRQLNSPFNTLTTAIAKSFGISRVDHEFILTPTTSEANAVFLIDILQTSGTTYIDNIALFESTLAGEPVSDNLFTGGQFENGISNIITWSPTNNHVAEWDTTSKINNVYNYLIKDATGAIMLTKIATSQPATLLLASSTAGTISTIGGTTTVVVSASGGIIPYSGTGTFSNVSAGQYNYTITDAVGCVIITPIIISQPFIVSASAPVINCFGGTTTATVTGIGGISPISGTGNFVINAGNGSLKISVLSPVSTNYTSVVARVGAVNSNKSYVLRFSTLGTIANGSLRVGLRQNNSPFNILSILQTKALGVGRTEQEFTFNMPTSENAASILIDVLQTSGTIYIDNIAFFESTTAGVPLSDNLFAGGQFENGISNIITWSPTNNHMAEWDTTSKINNVYNYLIKDATGSAIMRSVATVASSIPLTASSSAGIITVSGGTTTVVVSAFGGTAPYTGTGTFINVSGGSYIYTVTDALGCTIVTNLTISQPFGSRVIATAISCFKGNTTANVIALGGQTPYTGTGTYMVNAGTGSLKFSVLNPVALNSTSAYAPVGAVNIGKNYVLRFSTLGTSLNGSVKARLRMLNSPFNGLSNVGTKSFGLSRVDHEFIFTASGTEANACFLIDVLQSSGTTFIDNIAFFEATSAGVPVTDNLYSFGQFESGLGNIITWSPANNHKAEWDSSSKITNTYNFAVKDAAGAFMLNTVTTLQPVAPLVATATAGAIALTGATTTVTISATGGTAPYTGLGSFVNVPVGNYIYTVTDAAGCTSTVPVVLKVASAARFSNNNTLQGSSINANSLTSINNQQIEINNTLNNNIKKLGINVYPNPTENIFNLRVNGPIKELVYITITAVDGTQLYSTKGNNNSVYMFGNNFKPGMYFIKVFQGTEVIIQKIVKGKF